MSEGKDLVDAPAEELDRRMDEQLAIVNQTNDNYDELFDKLMGEGKLTPELETLVRFAERRAAAQEGLNWMEASVDSGMKVESFNALAGHRDKIAQDVKDNRQVEYSND